VTPPGGSRFTLIWEPAAVAGLIRLREADPAAAKDVRAAVQALAHDPEPETSSPLGTTSLRRMRLGSARVLYDVDTANGAVKILVVGQAQ
jgi:mRNA interferase RelE/StbE